jgi:hypothetical protein
MIVNQHKAYAVVLIGSQRRKSRASSKARSRLRSRTVSTSQLQQLQQQQRKLAHEFYSSAV